MTNATNALVQPPAVRWLTADQAAAYVAVPLAEFEDELEQGVWPAPARETPSAGRLWDRHALDAASDQLSGFAAERTPTPGDPAGGRQLLTIDEAAKLLRCSTDTLYRVPADQLPVCRPGKVNLYHREDVLRYASSTARARPTVNQTQIDRALHSCRADT